MKTDRQIIDQLHRALDSLHIACETSPPRVSEWYSTGMFSRTARERALEALKAARDHHRDAKPPAEESNETIEALKADAETLAEARREGYESGFEDGGGSSPHETIAALEADAAWPWTRSAAEANARQKAWAAGYHYANKLNTPKP
jgi:flagellar biosynthesis/type III secretory pathway protein FliH